VSAWNATDLAAIGNAEELSIAARGVYGTHDPALPIWVVRVGDELYIRSYKGTAGRWYRHLMATGVARMSARGVEADASFTAADENVNSAVDAVYRSKYARFPESIVGPMVAPTAQAATLRLTPLNRDLGKD
jgi:hypothetical protein